MADLRKFLQTFHNKDGKTLDDHIENTLTKLLLKNPRNWFESFEEQSLKVKQTNFDLQNLDADDNSKRIRESFSEMKEWGQKQAQVLIGKKQVVGEEEEAPPEEESKVS